MSAESIFGKAAKGLITEYRATLQVRDLLVGGVPSDVSVVRKWLEARMKLGDVALEELVAATVAERDTAVSAQDKVDMVMASEHAPSVNGFKRNENGVLCYEARCLKAALKEAVNSQYPGVNYPGKTDERIVAYVSKRKGFMRTFAEMVFVRNSLLELGVKEPTRVEERIKHVMTAQGQRSAIGTVEVVERPLIVAQIGVHRDFVTEEAWAGIWTRAEDIGIGADRGRSDGQFDLVKWERKTGTRWTTIGE